MLLKDIALFLHVVEKGSLKTAGHEIGLSSTAISERISTLEAHFGVALLKRTTAGTLSLTQEGHRLVSSAKKVLDEVDHLETGLRFGAHTLFGPIQVSTPSDIGRTVISAEIARFLSEHSSVAVELQLTDSDVNFVANEFDIVLWFGSATNSSLRVRDLGQKRRVVCAAPNYLESHGIPKRPDDLKDHNCLVMRYGARLDNVWRFGPDTMQQVIIVRGNRVANDEELVRQWCLAGHGIIQTLEMNVGPDIRTGILVELLTDHPLPATPLQMLLPSNRTQQKHVPALANQLALALLSI